MIGNLSEIDSSLAFVIIQTYDWSTGGHKALVKEG